MAEGTHLCVRVQSDDDIQSSQDRYRFSFKRLLAFMGPGILMSIAYVDPGNLESDLQVGAQAGYVLLWLLLLSTIMGLVVQMQAAKLGVATGKHLAQHCREQYPRTPRLFLWVMAELAIIGSDIQEVIGSSIALALLSGGRLPLWAGVLLTAVGSFSLLFIERLGIRVLEGFFGGMVGLMVVTFGVMYARAGVPTGEVIRGFTIPQLPRRDLPVAVALMGSLIMPHNIFLHSALVQTRQLGSDRPAAKREALLYFGIESALSLVVAVIINLFITAVFAAGFYGAELPDIGLQNAGRYLGETYGTPVVYIWALGLLAAGQSSTMTGTYTGQFVMTGFLDLKVTPWARVAITRAVAIVPTLAVALLCAPVPGGEGVSNQLDQLNQALNLLQSIQLPFALVPVLTFTSSPTIMGPLANNWATAAVCWAISGLVVAINGLAVYEVAYEYVIADPWVSGAVLFALVVLYLTLIGYMVVGPQSQLAEWITGRREAKGIPVDPSGTLQRGALRVGRPSDAESAAPLLGPRGTAGAVPDGLDSDSADALGLGSEEGGRICRCCPSCRCWRAAVEAVEEEDAEEAKRRAGKLAAAAGRVFVVGAGNGAGAGRCQCTPSLGNGGGAFGGVREGETEGVVVDVITSAKLAPAPQTGSDDKSLLRHCSGCAGGPEEKAQAAAEEADGSAQLCESCRCRTAKDPAASVAAAGSERRSRRGRRNRASAAQAGASGSEGGLDEPLLGGSESESDGVEEEKRRQE
ncbi:hypothetical protein HYH03_010415 [Edaphochlamys debaryana]|uniref:Uncharacterized protein n=1 Tax=Edaphochlamys debaryana TaxID=47281 RepID=A0A835XWM6_9CHLO|nr:hypothetical protein HYH03_010415 [Edaphochlamys debaryana]|eukprot:KAG2491205.1 hypothetical protein HYH03_010415 [Edaphochlamys debaryana]